MPGADGTQARHWTDAAAEGKQKDVTQTRASLSNSRIPLWRLDTVSEASSFLTCSFVATNILKWRVKDYKHIVTSIQIHVRNYVQVK